MGRFSGCLWRICGTPGQDWFISAHRDCREEFLVIMGKRQAVSVHPARSSFAPASLYQEIRIASLRREACLAQGDGIADEVSRFGRAGIRSNERAVAMAAPSRCPVAGLSQSFVPWEPSRTAGQLPSDQVTNRVQNIDQIPRRLNFPEKCYM